MKLKAWLDLNMASIAAVKVRIASSRKTRVPVATAYSPEALLTMAVRVFETMVQTASCHMEQITCANQTRNSINPLNCSRVQVLRLSWERKRSTWRLQHVGPFPNGVRYAAIYATILTNIEQMQPAVFHQLTDLVMASDDAIYRRLRSLNEYT